MINLIIYCLLLFLIILIFGSAAIASILAAPYVPTHTKDIKRMLQLAEVKKGERVYDLGSGDGRIALVAARDFGAEVFGIEISFLPYLVSKIRVALSGLSRQIFIRYGDFFQVNLHEADVVICFLTPRAMQKLSPKFRRELASGTRIVSYAFALKDWEPLMVDKPTTRSVSVFLYEKRQVKMN